MNNLVNQQDIPQMPWASEHVNILNQQKILEAQWKSGNEETDEERGFWIRENDLDML